MNAQTCGKIGSERQQRISAAAALATFARLEVARPMATSDSILKVCTKCGASLPATTEHFHRHPKSPDGLKPRCKRCQCSAEHVRRKAMTPEEKQASVDGVLAWRAKNKDRAKHTWSRWILKNPDKRRAHWAVDNAIRNGSMSRQPCEVCGHPVSDAHHDDYSKPLQVRWLCKPHHYAHHVKEREKGNRWIS